MAMTVLNNTASMMTLGELNKNITKVGKDLNKLSTGQRLAKFADSPSDVAISEKMRELIRSLGQNERNVQTGANLLKVAEGGVQEQLELLKTVKEKVINAANDSNTDEDRAILQKEIDQCLKEIDDIAQTTNYNGKRLLTGDPTDYHGVLVPTIVYHPVLYHDQPIWKQFDEVKYIEGSDGGLIPNKYAKLDDITGPFDVFQQENPKIPVAINSLQLYASYTDNAFSGGEDGDPKKISINFGSVYNNISDLNGKGFTLGGTPYVFTMDMNKNYTTGKKDGNGNPIECKKIDISSCLTWGDVANKMASVMNDNSLYSAYVNSGKIEFSTKYNSGTAQGINATEGVKGISNSGGTKTVIISKAEKGYDKYIEQTGVQAVTNTGAIPGKKFLGGGKNDVPAEYSSQKSFDPSTDQTITERIKIRDAILGEKAHTTVDISAATEGSGVMLHGNTDVYLFFKDGKDGPTTFPAVDANGKPSTTNPAIYFVGKDYNGAITLPAASGMTVNMRSNSMTVSATKNGTEPNNNWYVDNIPTGTVNYTYYDADIFTPIGAKAAVTEQRSYEIMKPLDLGTITETKSEKDATYATYLVDYAFGNINNVEDLINEMNYKTMIFANDKDSSPFMSYTFFDSNILGSTAGTFYTNGGGKQWIDLNEIRQDMEENGKSLVDAVTALFERNIPYSKKSEGVNGVILRAHTIGTPGNDERIFLSESGKYRHYTINFNDPAVGSIPNNLIGKGFRIYCATDEHEWWNFLFTGSQDPEFEEERPQSGTKDASIRAIRVDISGCKDANDVAKAFFEKANPYLTGINKHILKVAANTNTGEITFYDDRPWDLTVENGFETLMGKGGGLDETYGWWKIADGVYDNIYEDRGDKWKDMPFLEDVPMKLPVKEFAIQDNPCANRTLWLKLPETTLDKVLETDEVSVATKEARDKLLGERLNEQGEDVEVTGILDKGIVYLTDANVLIGSQIKRLNLSEDNIVNKKETATAAESTIRDADMAKEMVSFTKNNILMQASQAMMSQANQNASGVLGLLQ